MALRKCNPAVNTPIEANSFLTGKLSVAPCASHNEVLPESCWPCNEADPLAASLWALDCGLQFLTHTAVMHRRRRKVY